MIDGEYLNMTGDPGDGIQPSTVPVCCGFYLAIIKLSQITADILRCFYFSESCGPKDAETSGHYVALFRLDAALDRPNEEVPSFNKYESSGGPPDPSNLFHR